MWGKVGRVDGSGVSLVHRSDESKELMDGPLIHSLEILSAQTTQSTQRDLMKPS